MLRILLSVFNYPVNNTIFEFQINNYFTLKNRVSMQLAAVNSQLLWPMPSGGEWLTILLVVVVLFGGKKIPELARGLGKGIREFNDAKTGIKNELEAGMQEQKEPNK